MEKERKIHIGYIVIFWGVMVSFIYIFTEESQGINMMNAEWIALVVAITGVAGGIWAQIIQFKKDAQRIDGVNRISEDVKHTTNETNAYVTKRIEPNINHILDSVQGELKDNIILFWLKI